MKHLLKTARPRPSRGEAGENWKLKIILAFGFGLFVLLLAPSARASNFTVKAAGGGDYTTIQACATAMAAGDTCTVYAGTYSENVTVTAGSTGNYKTLTVNGSDVVTVKSFTLNSHTKLIGNCTSVPSAINTCGFNVQNIASPAGTSNCVNVVNGATDIYIQNNVLYACGNTAMVGTAGGGLTASYIYVQNNTMSYAGIDPSVIVNTTASFSAGVSSFDVASVGAAQIGWNVSGTGIPSGGSQAVQITNISGNTITFNTVVTSAPETNAPIELSPREGNGIQIDGNHWLVENNDISHYTLGIDFAGSFGVFRNNVFHGQTEAEASGNQHTDSIYTEPGSLTEHNLIEGNLNYGGSGPDAKDFLTQGQDGCAASGICFGVIIRYNTAHDLDGGDLSGYDFPHTKMYNNTFVNMGGACNNNCYGGTDVLNKINVAMSNSSDINNIYYFPSAQTTSGEANPIGFDSASATASGSWGHSLAYCNSSGSANCALFGHIYEAGSWTADPGNILGYLDHAPSNNPNFISLSGNNFHLNKGSPAIDAGTSLTSVARTDSGSGTSLVVHDPSYFQDGYGGLVNADWIAVGSINNIVQISSISYTTNTITLASPITRNNGDQVYLYKNSSGARVLFGSAPDMGAFEFGTSSSKIAIASRPNSGSKPSIKITRNTRTGGLVRFLMYFLGN